MNPFRWYADWWVFYLSYTNQWLYPEEQAQQQGNQQQNQHNVGKLHLVKPCKGNKMSQTALVVVTEGNQYQRFVGRNMTHKVKAAPPMDLEDLETFRTNPDVMIEPEAA